MTNNDNATPVRIWSIIQFDKLLEIRGQIPNDLANFPIYEYIANGVIKSNIGIIKRQDSILFYDVTHASEELKTKYSEFIMELEVKKIQNTQNTSEEKASTDLGEKIATVMRLTEAFSTSIMNLTGTYPKLSKTEIKALGHDFVSIENTPEGIKLTPTLSIDDGYTRDLYLKVDPSLLDESLLAKISDELTELTRKENGFYVLAKDESLKKDFL